MTKKKDMQTKLKYIIAMIIVTIGAGIFSYPTVASIWNTFVHDKLISGYNQSVEELKEEDLSAEWEKADAYNETCVKDNPIINSETYSTTDTDYENTFDVADNGLMGYVEIPSVDTKVPIFHYSNDEELNKGIGHIYGSSLPTGKIGTNTVLTGHRAVASSVLFTRLDEVVMGDSIYLHILDKTLEYKVCDIKTVLPTDVEDIVIDSEKSLVTLVTCTPYAVNTHRLVITAEFEGFTEEAEEVSTLSVILKSTKLYRIIISLSVLLFFMIACIIRYRKDVKVEAKGDRFDSSSHGDNAADISTPCENNLTDKVKFTNEPNE